MRIKAIVAGAALALAATIGSASAAEQFATLDGVMAVAMSNADKAAVTGTAAHFHVLPPGGGAVSNPKVASMQAAGFVGNEHGLRTAELASGVIDVCGFMAGC